MSSSSSLELHPKVEWVSVTHGVVWSLLLREQKILLNNIVTKQEWAGYQSQILLGEWYVFAGNLILVTIMLLCLASFYARVPWSWVSHCTATHRVVWSLLASYVRGGRRSVILSGLWSGSIQGADDKGVTGRLPYGGNGNKIHLWVCSPVLFYELLWRCRLASFPLHHNALHTLSADLPSRQPQCEERNNVVSSPT